MPSIQAAAERLSVSPGTLRRLHSVGLITVANGSVSEDDMAALSAFRLLDPSDPADVPWPALVVTVRASRRDPDAAFNERQTFGWDPTLDPFDRRQLTGVAQWWPARRPQDAQVLIVTARGWVLQAYEIREHVRQQDATEYRFDVVPHETGKTRPFARTRFPAKPGPRAYPIH
ncbi:hypothetical protein [Cellulomonas olei]|uniref:hypothetical protein n=1 Tax=Cellulomonas sp. P4 TaxID=3142533 RepID=UPI0031B9FF12